MDFSSITQMAFYGFTMSEAFALWRPLIVFVIGVAIYSMFVYKFYRFLSRKKIMNFKLSEYEMHPTLKKLVHGLEVIFMFPFIVFFWFLVMSVMLSIVTIEQTIQEIMFISVAYVSAVRVGAYYNEDLSKDMAKLIPFAILAIFLIDASSMVFINPFDLIGQLFSLWKTLAYYLVFVILLELVLRIITLRHRKRGSGKDRKEKESAGAKKMKDPEEAGAELDRMLENK